MTKQEIIRNTQLSAKSINMADLEGIELVPCEDYSIETYWANSASQSYCNDIEADNVRQA